MKLLIEESEVLVLHCEDMIELCEEESEKEFYKTLIEKLTQLTK
jgi:hypothetical protein